MLGELRARHPETVMIAEAYWDKEWELQQQGFNFCYDKRLYDRIIGQDASAVRDHLRADLSYQSRLVRFLENHDEPRIASCLPADAERAAAVAIATLPGATLWHEGQFEGRRVRPPVFLSRRPDEPPDLELADWYRRLLAAIDSHQVRAGAWRLLQASGWPGNQSCANLAAWSWAGDHGGDRHLVVVNLSGAAGPGAGSAGLAGPARPQLAAHRHPQAERVRAGRRRAGQPRAVRRPGTVAVPPARPAVTDHGRGMASVFSWLPGLQAVRSYRREWLARDLVAGVVLITLLVPQGMAYAELAGLPPITGLYTSIMCLLGYAVAGPSRILVLGPDSSLGPMIAASGDGKRAARGPIGRQRVPRAAAPPVRCQVRLALQVAPAAELRGFPIRRRRRQLTSPR